MPRYPLAITNHRQLGVDYDGPVFVWDIDKTYLSTGFSSVKGLARIPVEFAVDKRAIVGMPEVLRALRHGPSERYEGWPIYFVSASPPQLRRVIERKMLLDGVEHDGIVFKDWLKVLKRLRWGRLREQMGFKLSALLTGRLMRPLSVEYLVGDDAEIDAEAYSLYARLLSHHKDLDKALLWLRQARVAEDDIGCILSLLRRLSGDVGHVERIFIHLERGRQPAEFAALAPKVVSVRGSLQLALALFDMGRVGCGAVQKIYARVAAGVGGPERAQHLLHDAARRGLIGSSKLAALGDLRPG